MEKFRIAVVCLNMNVGGAQMMAVQLASYIHSDRFDLKVFFLGREIDNQIKDFLISHEISYECLGIAPGFRLGDYFRFSKSLKAFDPHVVHEHIDYTYSWVWTFLHRRPLVATIHGDPFCTKNRKVSFLVSLKAKQKKLLRVIGCSRLTAEQSIARFGLLPHQVGHIYNPIRLERFRPASPHTAGENFVFLHVASFIPCKNHEMLLEAFSRVIKEVPEARLRLAGQGELFEKIRSLAAEKNLSDFVEFCGNVSDIPSLMEKGNALVLSSTTEACPMVLLEAMAAELPVIATEVGGIPEIVTDNGIIVESGNAEAFADAMISLVRDPALQKTLSEAAKRNAPSFSSQHVAEQYEREYLSFFS